MSVQFDRDYSVVIGSIKIDTLDISFNVTKTLSKEPNTCELTIYNLNKDHRDELAKLNKPLVEIQAGYKDNIGLIFRGDVRDIHSESSGSDWMTRIASGDGEEATIKSRINESFSRGTPLSTVVQKLASAMRVNIGNASLAALSASFTGAADQIQNGIVLSGKVSTELDGLLRSAGLEWSIQDNELQIIEKNKSLVGTAVRLAEDSGLVGSPTIGNDGILQARALLNPSVIPGRLLEVESSEVPKAFYRAQTINYLGASSENDWYIDVEAKEVG